jgi:putative ABC transport system permease protein
MLRRLLVDLALCVYPSQFRQRYRHHILDVVKNEPQRFSYDLFDILKDGFSMRLENFARDLKYAVSRLLRTPLFVAIVTLTFALGIGVNVAVFSAFNAIVLRPLPFPNADRLVAISKRVAPRLTVGGPLTQLDVSDLRSQLHGAVAIAGVMQVRATLGIDGARKAMTGAQVGTQFFDIIGARAQVGRLFQQSDGRFDQHLVVISDQIYRTYFDGNLSAIGKSIDVDGTSYTVVGVALPGAMVPEPWGGEGGTLAQPDFFIPMPDAAPSYKRGIGGVIGAVAALAPGVSVAQLNSELLVLSDRVHGLYPFDRSNQAKITFVAQPLGEQLIGPVSSTLWMVLLAVFGILLIACANVANLVATRWAAREREVAVRKALGASTALVASQLFIETGLLAILGGVVAVALSYVALARIPLDSLTMLPRAQSISIDTATLLYALLMVCVTTVLAGLLPVVLLGRVDLQRVLAGAGRGGDVSRRHGLRTALLVVEVAIAFALVISSGLITRSLITILNAPTGFRSDAVFVSYFQLAQNDYQKLHAQEAVQEGQLLSRVAAIPGVDSASISLGLPLDGASGAFVPQIDGENCTANCPQTTSDIVSLDYFRTLGIPLLKGRGFAQSDSAGGALVAVVNQAFVDRVFHGNDAVGRKINVWGPWISVVGVVPNVSQTLSVPPLPEIYTPLAQHPLAFFALMVHAPNGALPVMTREIQSAFTAVYPDKEPPKVRTISDIIALETQTKRFAATLLGVLGAVSLLLALSGIYGVVTFSVAERSREFGIRMALGANTGAILRDVLGRSLTTSAIGVSIGIVLAALDARAIMPYLTQDPGSTATAAGTPPQILATPFDPLTFASVIALTFMCTALAALFPALRATRADPNTALRQE